MRRATSLNPRPDYALDAAETLAANAANAPVPPRLQIAARIESCVAEFGHETTFKSTSEWVRANREKRIEPARGKSRAEHDPHSFFKLPATGGGE
jgi:hypothetical protein